MAKLSKARLHEILSARFSQGFKKLSDIPNPSLLHDGLKSARRIATAIKNNEKIYIVGDYDVDGVTSTALMIEFFKAIGYPVEATIPNRFLDGYGVSEKIIDRIEADLVITVDNGINAFGAANACKKRGIDLIITDHHTPSSELPDAFAIIDPQLSACDYPFKAICGAQVAWLLMALVKKEIGSSVDLSQFLDLLCLAIVADVMPLNDINRTLVQQGLKRMGSSLRPCMVIIRDMLGKNTLSAEDIGFQIAPRINSAGRMEDASIALAFLTAQSDQEAYKQYQLLDQLNQIRKTTEADATEEAIRQVRPSDKIIVVANQGWHEGVVGIVASRLVQRFGKPSIVLSIENEVAKGSARSIGEISIYALIKAQSHLLARFGGHKMAAGLSLKEENIAEFKTALNKAAASIADEDYLPQEEILGEITSHAIDFELLDLLEEFEPYGEGNPRPRFLASKAEIVSVQRMGQAKEHAKIELRLETNDSSTHNLIYFRCSDELKAGQNISCSYTLNKNVFNGRTSIQLMLDKVVLK